MDPQPYAGAIVVTCLYVVVYYAMMIRVAKTKLRLIAQAKARGEQFDRYFGNNPEMLAADRGQLNMLEHMPTFLVLLWAHAVFVSATTATIVGGIYVASRALYPFVWTARMKGTILIATLPGYLMVLYFVTTLLYAAIA